MTAASIPRPGIWRRRMIFTATPGLCVGEMEDDCHQFRVSARHDGEKVIGVDGEPIRIPWTLCPTAPSALAAFAGLPLDADLLAPSRALNSKHQCTHMFDIASLAIACAARGIARRELELSVEVPSADALRVARLTRDGQPVMEWTSDMRTVLSPGPFQGQSLTTLLARGGDLLADPDMLEAAYVLRRGMMMSQARAIDLDAWETAADANHLGACFVFQPARAPDAIRIKGSTRDFTGAPERLLAH